MVRDALCCYELTAFGRRTAVFFTKTYMRIVNHSLAELDPQLHTSKPIHDERPRETPPRLRGRFVSHEFCRSTLLAINARRQNQSRSWL